MWKSTARATVLFLCLLAASRSPLSREATAGVTPEAGTELPVFQLAAPPTEKERDYLGLSDTQPFSLDKVNAQLFLIEIAGVYCPQCHIQAPLFNTLFNRLKRNAEVDSKVKMFAVTIGATPMEVEYMKKQFNIPFPVLPDTDFTIHKMLGEPRTPFTMIVTRDRKVVFTHLGVIDDMDAFFQQIQKLIQ